MKRICQSTCYFGVVRDGIIKPSVLKTFIFLKIEFQDRIILSNNLLKQISIGLDIEVKTARCHINQLINKKFIGFNQLTSALFIRSKYNLLPRHKRQSNYNVKVKINHLENFSEYVLCAIVSYQIRKIQLTAKYKLALTYEGAFRGLCAVSKFRFGYPISLTYIAQCLGRSPSWVAKYKIKAKKLGWLQIRHNWIETNIPWQQRMAYLSAHELSLGRAKKSKNMLFIIGPDLLTSVVLVRKQEKKYRNEVRI